MAIGLHNTYSATPSGLDKCQHRRLTWCRSYVYLATDGERVKVGFSTAPTARVRALRRRHPNLRLVRTWGGGDYGYVLEQIIHHDVMGRKHRWDGEWYAMPAEEAEARIEPVVRYWRRVWSQQRAAS